MDKSIQQKLKVVLFHITLLFSFYGHSQNCNDSIKVLNVGSCTYIQTSLGTFSTFLNAKQIRDSIASELFKLKKELDKVFKKYKEQKLNLTKQLNLKEKKITELFALNDKCEQHLITSEDKVKGLLLKQQKITRKLKVRFYGGIILGVVGTVSMFQIFTP